MIKNKYTIATFSLIKEINNIKNLVGSVFLWEFNGDFYSINWSRLQRRLSFLSCANIIIVYVTDTKPDDINKFNFFNFSKYSYTNYLIISMYYEEFFEDNRINKLLTGNTDHTRNVIYIF